MKRKELCEHCGASMMVNKYSLNKTLLKALFKMARNPNKKAREMGFDKSEYAVYTKLKFWNFIERLADSEWVVTDLGWRFLRGEVKAPKEITYFRNEVKEKIGSIFAADIFPTEESKQKYREAMIPLSGYQQ